MSKDNLHSEEEFFHEVFQDAQLPQGRLLRSTFEECTFKACNLEEATIVDSAFFQSTFVDCNLSLVKVPNTRFVDVDFCRSKLTGINWSEGDWGRLSTSTLRFEECILSYSIFHGLRLNATFKNCVCHQVDFSEANLSGCDFSSTDLTAATFNNTDMTGVNLAGAFGYSIDARANCLKDAKVSFPEAASLIASLGVTIVDSFDETASDGLSA